MRHLPPLYLLVVAACAPGIDVLGAGPGPDAGVAPGPSAVPGQPPQGQPPAAGGVGPASQPSCLVPLTCRETSCCTRTTIPGGAYDRFGDPAFPAKVSAFALDRYEVTVGRFKAFLAADDDKDGKPDGHGTQLSVPVSQSGAHPALASSGWSSAFDASLLETPTVLAQALDACAQNEGGTFQATDSTLPMTCVTWFEAFAFCAWDGGRLPTETEWNYAAAGGAEERVYPWSSPPDSVDVAQRANQCVTQDGGACSSSARAVGTFSPQGDSKWGLADMGGNAAEHVFDGFVDVPPALCNDCAVQPAGPRVVRGGSWLSAPDALKTRSRQKLAGALRQPTVGFRCAYAP